MTFESLLIFAGLLTVACIIPGPGVITLLSRTLGSGWSSGMAFLIGITLGDLIFVTLAFFGMAALAQNMGDLFQWIKWAGALFLVYMGYQLIMSKGQGFNFSKDKSKPATFLDISSGLLLTLGNPKPFIFYAAIMPQVLDVTAISLTEFSLVLLTVVIVLFAVCCTYIWLATRASKFLSGPKMQTRLSQGSGAVLLGTATWVAFKA